MPKQTKPTIDELIEAVLGLWLLSAAIAVAFSPILILAKPMAAIALCAYGATVSYMTNRMSN